MKTQWRKLLSREGVDILTISGLDAVFYESIWRHTKKRGELFFTWFQGKNFTHYIGVDPLKLGRTIYQKKFSSPKHVQKYYRGGRELLRVAHASVRKIHRESLGYSFEKFRSQFFEINHVYSIESWLALEAWQHDFDDLLNKLIKRNQLEVHRSDITDALSRPWKKTALRKVNEALYKRIPVNVLVKRYQFLRSWSAVWYRPINATWVRSLPRIRTSQAPMSRQQALVMLQPTPTERRFFENARHNIFFKDWRDDVRREFVYIWSPLFDRIAEHFAISREALGYFTLTELSLALKKNVLQQKIVVARKKNPSIITTHGSTLKMIVRQSGLQKYLLSIGKANAADSDVEVRGTIAYRGKVRGQVVILHNYHDLRKVKRGSILVANTTHPNYLPAMERAAAFVTNEGGIISHAAIVAREMHKPCIVGTKHATKVLNDGDLVDVDAVRGIVKILQRGIA